MIENAHTVQRSSEAPCLLLNITHGFQARMLLRSEIATTLMDAGCTLVICSANATEPYFAKEFSHPQIRLEPIPTQSSRWELRLSNWRQYVLMNPALGATLNHKRECLRAEQPRRYAITRAANVLLGNIKPLRNFYMAMERRLFPGREFDSLLRKYRPDLCVTGTPGFNLHDVHLLRACQRNSTRTACVMLSWDNLTSKGYMNGVPDYLLVWSELMAQEAREYHDFPAANIHLTGAAQFDHYYQSKETVDVISFRQRNNIPSDAFLMVYGTINPGICGHEISILRSIIQQMRHAELSRKPFLWIRLHPQVVNGPWKGSLKVFQELNAEDVFVEIPPVVDSKLDWDLPKEDALHLKQLLASANLLVTTSSTLSIDAACAGTPVANVFYDGIDVPDSKSVRRFRFYTHYAQILQTGGIAQAQSEQEFVQIMRRYDQNPRSDCQGRAEIIRQQLSGLDGNAGRRTAQRLIELCRADKT